MMEKQDNPIGMLIGRMIQEVFRALRKRTGEQTETKLTGEQFGLLYAISLEEKEVIQKDMAEVMCRDKSAILRMIDLLEEKELVRRVVDKNDRRKNYIMVTKKGEKVIEQYLAIELQLTRELQEGLSESDWDTFCKVIHHIRNKAGQL
jgi:MarR family transcriptional regulator, transcriptional regulator for hemolysin